MSSRAQISLAAMDYRKKKVNPNCPVGGCKAALPHARDPIVEGMIRALASPVDMSLWALRAMAELSESICRDRAENRAFAWYTRLHQPEELYHTTLYALFIASDLELHHLLSGEMPNGFSRLYAGVNEVIYLGRGMLQVEQSGLNQGKFKPTDILNDGAHVSFTAIMNWIGLLQNPQYMQPPEEYYKHLQRYCANLEYIHGMFKAGREKEIVLEGVRNLHRSASDLTAR
jgi:hypothetical protein